MVQVLEIPGSCMSVLVGTQGVVGGAGVALLAGKLLEGVMKGLTLIGEFLKLSFG